MPTPDRFREDYDPDPREPPDRAWFMDEREPPEPPDEDEPEDNKPSAVEDRLTWDGDEIADYMMDVLDREAYSRDFAEEEYWANYTDA